MFNTLLVEAKIPLASVRLLRHKDQRADKGRSPYELWRDNRQFDSYQSRQNIKAREKLKAVYWASFVGTFGDETLFVGLYRVKHLGLLKKTFRRRTKRALTRRAAATSMPCPLRRASVIWAASCWSIGVRESVLGFSAPTAEQRITDGDSGNSVRQSLPRLRKRGVGKDLAAQTAGSAHGPWRMADSPGLSHRAAQCLLRLARDSEINCARIAQLAEPPDADPHVRWCGRGGAVRLPPIPIGCRVCSSAPPWYLSVA